MSRSLVAGAAVLAALSGAAAALYVTRDSASPPVLERAAWLEEPRALPGFALVDAEGRGFGRDRLRGRWSLLFFGFVSCPDVCPLTLAELAEARRRLAPLRANDRPGIVFVSVDPGRDTPALIGRYVRHFDPGITGATGSADALAALVRAAGAAVVIGARGPDGGYAVDHSASVFVVDPDARIVSVLPAPHDAETIARDFRRIAGAPRG